MALSPLNNRTVPGPLRLLQVVVTLCTLEDSKSRGTLTDIPQIMIPKSILTELVPLSYREVAHGTAPHWRAEVKRTGTQDKEGEPQNGDLPGSTAAMNQTQLNKRKQYIKSGLSSLERFTLRTDFTISPVQDLRYQQSFLLSEGHRVSQNISVEKKCRCAAPSPGSERTKSRDHTFRSSRSQSSVRHTNINFFSPMNYFYATDFAQNNHLN